MSELSPAKSLATLRLLLDACLSADRPRLAKRLEGLERRVRRGQPIDRGLPGLETAVSESQGRCEARQAALPVPKYPPELPVSAEKDRILSAIAEHQVVVICGETGSGKTTQLPKICLELGRGAAGMIGHTQPRRIAARAVASRVAEELETEIGHGVGFKVRFSDHVGPDSYLKLMTDGILLAEIQGDPLLSQYDTLIIDEAHERSLNIDFLLGYLKQLLPQRPDLKLIITSATIDPERFARHFGDAPVIEVSGRTYPVEVRYRPLVDPDSDEADRSRLEGIVAACDELAREGPGDILVFLAGEREIREAAEALRKHHPAGTEILPLYARLSAAEQNRVFRPHGGRRIVLATNVAETSLTVPGIHYVVDPGQARVSRYSWRAKVQRLPVEPVSQASANQRAGRCGRVAEGVCIRLYSQEDFESRPAFTDPEILRTNLASVILQMAALGLGDVERFPFIEAPDSRQVKDGYLLLEELHAVDARQKLSLLGRQLARLPIDPRLGRMLLGGRDEGALAEVLVIVAALAVQDPRERPLEHQQAADEKHARFRDEHSDFLALLNLWRYFHEQRRHLSNNQLRKLCQREFLSWMRMREWVETHRQLHGLLREMGFAENQVAAEYAPIHRALLTGLLGQVGNRSEEKAKPQSYLGARNRRFYIFPGSGLQKRAPKWLMAAELTETTRLYARTVARIEPEWLESLGAHLLKHHIHEPHWEQKPARVVAYDRQTLYGLVVNPRKRVDYARTHPREARELFIRHALVYGDYRSDAPFLHHNRDLIEDIESLEAKARRRDILVDEETLFAFYDRQLPPAINNGAAFEKWRRGYEHEHPKALFLTREALMQHAALEVTGERFPDSLTFPGGLRLPLHYQLEPGSEADGVTLVVPAPVLNQVDAQRCAWLVPGLLEEKVTTLIRGLPKALRRSFVPAPDFARACVSALPFAEGDLLERLTHQLQRMTGVEVPREQWDEAALPEHLRMRFEVVDGQGKPLAADRDLEALRARLEGRVAETFEALPTSSLERDEVTAWDFGDLPETVEIESRGLKLAGYPTLTVEGERLALRIVDSAEKAQTALRSGLIRLLRLELREQVKYLHKNLPDIQQSCLQFASIGRCEALKDDIVDAALARAFLAEPLPRTQSDFEARLEAGRSRLVAEANEIAEQVSRSLTAFGRVRKALKGNIPMAWLEAVNDVRDQLEHLIYPGFVSATPPEALPHLQRYLTAVERRLEKLERDPGRDRRSRLEVEPLWTRCKQALEAAVAKGRISDGLQAYRWQIEELRVSLFAQELGTPGPVSVQRLEKRWAEIKHA
ncbi:MAG: ATP-dependent RNA helicase HrpA [Gammaproteobacteria bacterium]